jgi:hypothetical protein
MGSTELAANLFRATQTEEKLNRDNIKGKVNANKIHYEVGKKVRETIEDLGGTMPENLPIAKSIKEIEKEKKEISKAKTTYTLKDSQNGLTKIAEKTTEPINCYMPDYEWGLILSKLKERGRMLIYSFLVDTKAMLNEEILFIYFHEKNAFSKTIMSKLDNIQIIHEIISETHRCREVVTKYLEK